MKKTIYTLPLSLLLSLTSYSQDSVTINFNYSPSTTYRQTSITKTTSTITYSGSEEIIENLNRKGIGNPTETEQTSTTILEFITGEIQENGRFPITIEHIFSDQGNGEKTVPDGTKIFGWSTTEQMPSLDSISSVDMDEEFKTTLLQTMQTTLSQLKFPAKTLSLGESYIQKNPLTIPFADIVIELEIISTYTLKAIDNNLAILEVKQDYKLNSNIEKYKIDADGNGAGEIKFDIDKNFFTEYLTDMSMTMNIDVGAFKMEIIQSSESDQKTIIN